MNSTNGGQLREEKFSRTRSTYFVRLVIYCIEKLFLCDDFPEDAISWAISVQVRLGSSSSPKNTASHHRKKM
jgi:hypothetical protein